MEFTVKQKIVAAVIAGLLVFAFLASTIAAVVVSRDQDTQSDKDLAKREKQLKEETSTDPDGISSTAKPEDVKPAFDAQIKHDQSVAVAKKSETQASPDSPAPQDLGHTAEPVQGCSANIRSSLEGYRDGLVSLEHKRWNKVQKDKVAKSTGQNISESSTTKEVSIAQQEAEHKARLDEIEREFQHFLKQNECV